MHAVLRQGQHIETPHLIAHIEGCPGCATLVEGGPAFAESLDALTTAESLDSRWTNFEQVLEQERGPASWLRSRTTAARAGLVAVVMVLVPTLVWLTWRRVDSEVYPLERLMLDIALVTIPSMIGLVVVMRPLYRRAWPRGVEIAVAGLAGVAVLVTPMLTPAHHAHPASLEGIGADLVHRAAVCLITGIALGLPLLLWMVMILRRRGRFGLPLGLALVLVGLVGSLAVFLHCPLVAPVHLLAGHAMVSIVFLALALVAGLGRRHD